MAKQDVEFTLFAPYNKDVAVVGDWNNWNPTPMKKDNQGWWHIKVPLKDGEYQYKFEVQSNSYFALGQKVQVTDPRAVSVSYDQNENACVTIKNGKPVITTYHWKHDDVPLPPNDSLIIYELHVNEFSGGIGDERSKGRFVDAIKKLDYLAELGINAVELMPLNEFPGERSWGYNPRVLFAVENSYGTPDEFCQLVDECHARGMRVILDGVYNHTEDKTPLAQIDYEYWYYKNNPDRPEVQWGPKFNYEHFDDNLKVWPAREYVRDAILYWIDHFHIDGIRFDATAIINNYDLLHYLKSEIFNHIKDVKPFFTIAEHVPQDPTVTGIHGPMDAAWYESFSKQMMCTIVGKDQDGHQPFNLDAIAHVIDPRDEGFGSPHNVILYIDNHDQNRIMWQLGQAGMLDDVAFRRMRMGAAVLLTAPGIPMIWMGQEFGESAPKQVNERQTIDWALLQNDRNTNLLRYYQGLTKLHKENPALLGETFEIIYRDDARCLLGYKRWNDEGNIVIVVVNFKDEYAGGFEISNWPNGNWHEWVYNYDIEVGDGVMRDELAESGVKIYVKMG